MKSAEREAKSLGFRAAWGRWYHAARSEGGRTVGRVASPLAHDKGYYHSLRRSRKGTFGDYIPGLTEGRVRGKAHDDSEPRPDCSPTACPSEGEIGMNNPDQFAILGMDNELIEGYNGGLSSRFYTSGTRKYGRIVIRRRQA